MLHSVPDRKSSRSLLQWSAVTAVVAISLFIVIQRPWITAPPIASSSAIEGYATLILKAQKTFFAAQKSYASTLEQLKIEVPPPGVTVDYRGSSPLGFCWLARTGNGVWYTISQTRVARSEQAISARPPTACL